MDGYITVKWVGNKSTCDGRLANVLKKDILKINKSVARNQGQATDMKVKQGDHVQLSYTDLKTNHSKLWTAVVTQVTPYKVDQSKLLHRTPNSWQRAPLCSDSDMSGSEDCGVPRNGKRKACVPARFRDEPVPAKPSPKKKRCMASKASIPLQSKRKKVNNKNNFLQIFCPARYVHSVVAIFMNGILSLFSSANEQGSIIAVESPTKSGKCLCVLYQTFCEVCPHFLGLLIMHACIQLEWFSVCLVCIQDLQPWCVVFVTRMKTLKLGQVLHQVRKYLCREVSACLVLVLL